MEMADLQKHLEKILKILKYEQNELRCVFEAEWQPWKILGVNNSTEIFFGFGLAQNYSCLMKFCETFLVKLNLTQFNTKRKLGSIMKDAKTDSKETMSKLYEAMGNDPAVPEEDKDLGSLLLNALESLIRGDRFVLQKGDLGKLMLEKQQDYMEASSLFEDLPIRVMAKQNKIQRGSVSRLTGHWITG